MNDDLKGFWDIVFAYTVFLVVAGFMFLALASCAPPKVSELLKNGVNCKASITLPESGREGEMVEVDVSIYDCEDRVDGR